MSPDNDESVAVEWMTVVQEEHDDGKGETPTLWGLPLICVVRHIETLGAERDSLRARVAALEEALDSIESGTIEPDIQGIARKALAPARGASAADGESEGTGG